MVHVYQGSELAKRANGSQVVGKFANVAASQLTSGNCEAFYQEISLHWMLRDTPGFARVYGYSESPVATIFMEFYPLGALQSYIYA